MIKTFVSIFLIFIILLLFTPTRANEKNLAKYRVVIHSSSSDANHCGHLVVDGSLETFWESQPGNHHRLTIDLGSSQTISKVVIWWGTNYGTEYQLTASSKNNLPGATILSISDGKGGSETITCAKQKAQIIQLDISKVKNPIQGCVIKEIEVFGEGSERFVPSGITQLSANKLTLNGKMWRIQNAMFVNDKPQDIAKPGYNDKEWIPAKVPGTVMGSYYDFGALPDPFFGDNMHQISDEFFSGNNFWYRTSVRFPSQLSGKRLFLDFAGINWKAEVYFNSQYLGRIDGTFMRGEFEVTKLINNSGVNTIAVLVHHPDHWVPGPKKVIRKYIGSKTTNGDLLALDSPAMLVSAGWNFSTTVKGRHIGIWNEVSFHIRDNVSIIDPWVSSVLALPDTTKADLIIHTELRNQSQKAIDGILVARFGETKIEYPIKLNAGERKSIALDKSQFPQLVVKNPKLWWPNTYGKQNLYQLSLRFIVNGKSSDNKLVNFGIRQLDHKVINNVLFFYCNGQRLLIRGGNWGLAEGMLRCDSIGYDTRLKLHKAANLNMIRNWIGMTGHEWFYDACDRYGLLVWDDFWIANPNDGPDPQDSALFMNNVRDKIKWVRKHPSLALYCGRNEGLPPSELDTAMQCETQKLDGTRLYIPQSAAGIVSGHGPYDLRDLKWYFLNRGFTLHSEQGIVAFPEVESMRRMMPAKDLWPINDMWAIHDYQWGRSNRFTDSLESRFGVPTGVEDYCRRAQLLNYESAKAMFESLQSNQGSGILLWMSQTTWPSLICQLYDHYFEYTSAYFSAKKACQPIHVFWDILKNEIRIANNTSVNLQHATVKATIYNAKGEKLWEKSLMTDVSSASAKSCFLLEHQVNEKVDFLKLELTINGKMIDDNFYWLENSAKNCLDLNNLPSTKVSINAIGENRHGAYSATIKLKNTSSNLSLLNKIKVKDNKTGESILPVYLSDDYVSLLPGEEKTITLSIDEKLLKNRSSEIWVEGWNTERVKINLTANRIK